MKYIHKNRNRKSKKTRKNVSSTTQKSKSLSSSMNKKQKTLKNQSMVKWNKMMYGGNVNDSQANQNTHRDKLNEILEKMVQLNQKIKQIENMMETQNKSVEIKPEKDEVIVQITSGKSMVESGVNLKGNNQDTVLKTVQ